MMLLTGGDRKAAQRLWLRKVRIHMEAPQSSREQPLADSRTPAGSSPSTGRAQAGDDRPAREARAQPDPAAPKAPREQDVGDDPHCQQAAGMAPPSPLGQLGQLEPT